MATLIPQVILRENNPYSIGTIFQFDEGDYLLDPGELLISPSVKDRYYTVGNTDNLSNISFQAYGDSKWWWVLYYANPDLENPFELPIGKTLLVPDLIQLQTQNA